MRSQLLQTGLTYREILILLTGGHFTFSAAEKKSVSVYIFAFINVSFWWGKR